MDSPTTLLTFDQLRCELRLSPGIESHVPSGVWNVILNLRNQAHQAEARQGEATSGLAKLRQAIENALPFVNEEGLLRYLTQALHGLDADIDLLFYRAVTPSRGAESTDETGKATASPRAERSTAPSSAQQPKSTPAERSAARGRPVGMEATVADCEDLRSELLACHKALEHGAARQKELEDELRGTRSELVRIQADCANSVTALQRQLGLVTAERDMAAEGAIRANAALTECQAACAGLRSELLACRTMLGERAAAQAQPQRQLRLAVAGREAAARSEAALAERTDGEAMPMPPRWEDADQRSGSDSDGAEGASGQAPAVLAPRGVSRPSAGRGLARPAGAAEAYTYEGRGHQQLRRFLLLREGCQARDLLISDGGEGKCELMREAKIKDRDGADADGGSNGGTDADDNCGGDERYPNIIKARECLVELFRAILSQLPPVGDPKRLPLGADYQAILHVRSVLDSVKVGATKAMLESIKAVEDAIKKPQVQRAMREVLPQGADPLLLVLQLRSPTQADPHRFVVVHSPAVEKLTTHLLRLTVWHLLLRKEAQRKEEPRSALLEVLAPNGGAAGFFVREHGGEPCWLAVADEAEVRPSGFTVGKLSSLIFTLPGPAAADAVQAAAVRPRRQGNGGALRGSCPHGDVEAEADALEEQAADDTRATESSRTRPQRKCVARAEARKEATRKHVAATTRAGAAEEGEGSDTAGDQVAHGMATNVPGGGQAGGGAMASGQSDASSSSDSAAWLERKGPSVQYKACSEAFREFVKGGAAIAVAARLSVAEAASFKKADGSIIWDALLGYLHSAVRAKLGWLSFTLALPMSALLERLLRLIACWGADGTGGGGVDGGEGGGSAGARWLEEEVRALEGLPERAGLPEPGAYLMMSFVYHKVGARKSFFAPPDHADFVSVLLCLLHEMMAQAISSDPADWDGEEAGSATGGEAADQAAEASAAGRPLCAPQPAERPSRRGAGLLQPVRCTAAKGKRRPKPAKGELQHAAAVGAVLAELSEAEGQEVEELQVYVAQEEGKWQPCGLSVILGR